MKRRRKIDVTNCTLIELAYARTGSMLRAAKVVAFIQAWGVARRHLEREPTVEEYADYWRQSLATAYRERILFRQVFPALGEPGPVLDLLHDQAADEPRDWAAALASPSRTRPRPA